MRMRNSNTFRNFTWGVSTSAAQIEGAASADGRGPSIWDVFAARRRRILNGDTPAQACDHYNRFEEDIELLAELGVNAYRFSISWSRLLPEGTGTVNQKGIDFYSRLIDRLLEKNIQPFVTLYHWDLPQILHEKGGWTSRDIIDQFREYTELIADNLGDRIKNFIILNEPVMFTLLGYFLGVHAPGHRRLSKFLAAVHHSHLAQAEAGRLLREKCPEASIGSSHALIDFQPYSFRKRDIIAAEKAEALMSQMYLDPPAGKGYPFDKLRFLRRIEKHVKTADMNDIRFDFDFMGLNHYSRMLIKSNRFVPYAGFRPVKPPAGRPLTAMKWEVYPQGIYNVLKRYADYAPEIYITENGAAFHDVPENGRVHDSERIDYLQSYLNEVNRAKRDGINISGYFVWSLLDNFEWAEGYHPRFGLVYVDYRTKQRIPKDSFYWYRDFIQS